MDWKTLFLSANGRIGRQSFWIGVAILFVAGLLLNFIPIIGQLAALALTYCWVCVYSKRLHDFGKTGWLAAVPFALMIVFMILGMMSMGGMAAVGAFSGSEKAMAGAAMGGMGVMAMLGMLFALLSLAFLLWVGLTPGDPGSNTYGEPPAPTPLAGPRADAPPG